MVTRQEPARRKRRSNSFVRARRRLFLRRLLIFGICIPAIVFGIYYYWTSQNPQQDDVEVENVETVENSIETLIKQGTVSEWVTTASRLSSKIGRISLPNRVEVLKNRIVLGSEIERAGRDEKDERYITIGRETKIDAMVVLDKLNHIHELGYGNIRQELLDEAIPMLNDKDPALRAKAHYVLNQTKLLSYFKNPTEENFSLLYSQMEESIPIIQNQYKTVVLFNDILITLYAKGESRTGTVQIDEAKIHLLHRFVGDQFRKNKDKKTWDIGTKIHDRILVGDTDFESLNTLLTLPDEQAVETLEWLTNRVAETRIGSRRVYRNLIEAIDCLSQSGREEQADNLMQLLKDSVSLIQDEVTINHVELMFEMLEKRENLIGTEFVIRGVDFTKQQVANNFNDRITVVVFFSMHDVDSIQALTRFKNLSYLESSGVRFVAVCGDAAAFPQPFTTLVAGIPSMTFLDDASSEEYMKRCPVSFVPYVLILDRDHKVVANNPLVDRVRVMLEQMAATSHR